MKAFNRTNCMGEFFCLVEMPDRRTLIRLMHDGSKCIVVNQPVSIVVMAWHKWTNGMLVQDAFPTWGRWDREFIQTGITKNEYERLYTE